MLRFNENTINILFLICAGISLWAPSTVSATCSVQILDARKVVYKPARQVVTLKHPWPANDGNQLLDGVASMNISKPVYGADPRYGNWAALGAVTASEMQTLMAPVRLEQRGPNLPVVLADGINHTAWLTQYGYVDWAALLRTGGSDVRYNKVTNLRVTQVAVGAGSFSFDHDVDATLPDPQLCQKLAENGGHNGELWFWYDDPDMQLRLRHSLNSQRDTFTAPLTVVVGYQLQKWVKLRAVPNKLIFGSNPAGKTINRDVAIGLSSSIQSRVRYTFSYSSVSKTGEEVLIDGRSLPVQFIVSLPASNNSNSFTDFKHQVSLTSPDPGKVDGNILVVAEML